MEDKTNTLERGKRCFKKLERQKMVPFRGSCGIKHNVQGKPNPEGLKSFVFSILEGYSCLSLKTIKASKHFFNENFKKLSVRTSAITYFDESLF